MTSRPGDDRRPAEGYRSLAESGGPPAARRPTRIVVAGAPPARRDARPDVGGPRRVRLYRDSALVVVGICALVLAVDLMPGTNPRGGVLDAGAKPGSGSGGIVADPST
ncbi:MAG: hypothetical protein H0V74_06400, partial [Chloroflexi bacterium]|nr:hypothetical protein [Chloroflexota bacterium]